MRFPPAERLPLADFSKHAWFRDNRDVTPDTIWVCFCNIYIIFFIKIYLINKLLIITKRVHFFTAFNAHFRSRFAAKMLPVIWGLAGFYVLKSLNPFRANLRGPEERVCFWFSSLPSLNKYIFNLAPSVKRSYFKSSKIQRIVSQWTRFDLRETYWNNWGMKLKILLLTWFRVTFAQIGRKEENLERIGESKFKIIKRVLI